MSTAANRLQIRRFCAEYFISAQHPNPHHLKARLDETIERRLAPALSEVFSSWFSTGDSSVWIIRRLDFDIALNAALEREQITRDIRMEVGKEDGAAPQEGSDSATVLLFANRAAYLASFLCDVACNAAWDKWYYESFSGLKPLPASAAIRTAICDDPVIGLDALRSMQQFDLGRVLGSLS